MASSKNDTRSSSISAVRAEEIIELIREFSLSYPTARSDVYILLHDAMANIHLTNQDQSCIESLLHCSVRIGDIEIIERLLDGSADIEAKNIIGETPLDVAVHGRKMEIVKLLLNKGARFTDINTADAIFVNAVGIRYLPLVEHLLNDQACVDSVLLTCTSGKSYTPLCLAVERGSELIIKLLLSKGVNIDAKRKDGVTPLHLAVEKGYEKVVMLLLENGADVDAQDSYGKTILHLAVEKQCTTIIEDIIKYRPDVNNKNNRSALHTAVYGPGKIYNKIVENLLEYGFTIYPEDVSNHKLLYTAVENGYLKIIERLLQYGADVNVSSILSKSKLNEQPKLMMQYTADVNATDEIRTSTIFYAYGNTNHGNVCNYKLRTAIENGYLKIVERLFQHGADINTGSKFFKSKQREEPTVLMNYTANLLKAIDEIRTSTQFYGLGNTDLKIIKLLLTNGANEDDNPELLDMIVPNKCREIVKFLLENSADIDVSNEYGRKACRCTAFSTDKQMVKLLISKGARTEHFRTALHANTQYGYVKLIEALLEYTAGVDSTPECGITLLHISAYVGNEVISKMLLNRGADVNAKQCDGTTALHIATLHGNIEIVEVLLRCGAKVNLKANGLTPLHIAVEKGYSKITEFLLRFGANIDSRNTNGETALHIACFRGSTKIVVVLLKYGSDINIVSGNNHTCFHHNAAGIFLPSNIGCIFYSDNGAPRDGYMRSCKVVLEILNQHAVQMKTVNSYEKLKMNSDNELVKEIYRMKSEKIGNANVSFYDIMTKGINRLASYAGNENIVRVLGSNVYKKKYPIYADMIQSNFMRGKRRKELLEQGTTVFHFLSKDLPVLPSTCTEKIFNYISDEDLRILLDDFTEEAGRKGLLEQGYRFFHFTFNNSPQLPYNCTEKIFSYLNDEDLRILIIACKPTNIDCPNIV